MSSARTPNAASPRQAWRKFGFWGIALLALSAPAAEAATASRTYFFATREACAASGAFTVQECASAFANARLQLRALAPRFESSSACRMRFRLCSVARIDPQEGEALGYAQDEAIVFTPMALGVEMVASAKGAEAAPTLAIDTPARLFPYAPVARPYEPPRPGLDQPGEFQEKNVMILAADHFEPFSKRKPFDGPMTFTASALGAIVGATHDVSPAETREERRARLKTAPFME
ncbi:DUF1190 domain-containing protein [Methylocystis sp. MJC1]|jgi:hypothetical protein|uniref:DUF1190 domain-containing protein n=1 Tax=Methylocystis sp. MJC1 TaxID=2654282 RepID=UPI0013ED9458|nr:DUF1190 domain-containing protein [Methylocystis sp. MJC1]KAF2992326.1 hypothetical protein MJC1_00707 [Methylocystis sp. MJC1]MBU6527464.1 DUF1190 domain-containing protein [Methylocystis sp. MJC1]UZX10410.1 DUF1190 domain-containing protein [Methylocystis sp. MJC1]